MSEVSEQTTPRVLLLRLAYDGTDFKGFAKQPGLRTVEGVLEEALSTVLRPSGRLEISVAGRTDAGVHALGQVVSVRTDSDLSVDRVQRSLRKLLPSDIEVAVEEAGAGFDARRLAIYRKYRYRLLTSARPDPHRRNGVWWTGELASEQVEVLERAAELVVGTHDFRSFCKDAARRPDTTRTVEEARWRRPECSCGCCAEELWFEIKAKAFCQEMVRRLVGAMVGWALEGEEPLPPERVVTYSWKPAPPQGLYLVEVGYP